MISLPAKLDLHCGNCNKVLTVKADEISDLPEISCPFCRKSSPVLELLPVDIRLLVYREIRERIENRALDSLNDSGINSK